MIFFSFSAKLKAVPSKIIENIFSNNNEIVLIQLTTVIKLLLMVRQLCER